MTTRQEEFEAWYSNYGEQPRSVEKSPNGTYKFISAAVAWSTWQASTLRQEAKIKVLTDALEQIKHSITQMQLPGNDKRREVLLIQNTVAEALALSKETP